VECNLLVQFVENSKESAKHYIDFKEIFSLMYILYFKVTENKLESIKHCVKYVKNQLGEYNFHIMFIETFVAKYKYCFTCMVWKDENN